MKSAESQPGALPPPPSTFIRHPSRIPKFIRIIPPLARDALEARAMGGTGFYALGTKQPVSSTGLVARNAVTSPEKDAAAGGTLRTEAFTSSARSAPAPSMSYTAESVQPTQWKVAGGKLWKSSASDWQDAYPQRDGDLEFSAVASRGKDVWAGGSHATLLHSRTGGMDWERVKLEDGASGSIVQISMEGLNVVVKTSDQQTWASQDGGKIWTSQPSN